MCTFILTYLMMIMEKCDVSLLFCRLSVPYASHAVFVGSELGFYKLWSEEFGFTVTIDNAANIALTLTKHHANRTCGLCGNFNSVSADEYTAQEGRSEVFNCVCMGYVNVERVKQGRVHYYWNLGNDLSHWLSATGRVAARYRKR